MYKHLVDRRLGEISCEHLYMRVSIYPVYMFETVDAHMMFGRWMSEGLRKQRMVNGSILKMSLSVWQTAE